MDPRLQELLDHHEIRQLLARYAHGCDRGDATVMGGVYAEESWDDHGPNKCDGRSFAAIITDDLVAHGTMCSHLMGQSLIIVDGDAARAETYFLASISNRPGDPDATMHQLGGRYIDTLTRAAGTWKIARRICVRDWSASQPVRADWLQGAGFVGGCLGTDDPGAALMRIR